MLGKVEYTLPMFWKDLLRSVEEEYPGAEKLKYESIQRLAYQVIYAACIGKRAEEIDENMGLPEGLAESILFYHPDDVKMLKAIIMGMFLRNLKSSFGLLNDSLNLQMVNAQLRQFHMTYNL